LGCGSMISLQIRNYGGVYVGLPSEAATMAPSQTKTEPKGTCRLFIVFPLLSPFILIF
uniref:Uncharacterized protein n=1 Tax=Chelydra serpentina TaxID=8475 RepID=A0A8C3RMJ8_CHESE